MDRNRERVTRALDYLTSGLFPFVEQELKAIYRDRWHDVARESFRDARGQAILKGSVIKWDLHTLLTVMWDQWNRVFRHQFGMLERSLVSELREYRNHWAHQAEFSFDDTYRILDSAERLLTAVKSPLAEQIRRDKADLLRTEASREAKAAYRKLQIRKRKLMDLSIYATCCTSILIVLFTMFGIGAWFFGLFVVFVFAYLAQQRLQSIPPIFFGPHECHACGKIIYGESCPYCDPPRPATSAKPSTEAAGVIKTDAESSPPLGGVPPTNAMPPEIPAPRPRTTHPDEPLKPLGVVTR